MFTDRFATVGVVMAFSSIWAVFSTAAAAIPPPVHAYEFQGSLEDSGTGGIDILSEGGVAGDEYFEFNPMYPGDYVEGLTLVSPALTNPAVYSIEMRIKYDHLRNETPSGSYGPDQSWIKTIDFTDSLYSYGLYVEDVIRWEGPGEEGLIEFIASTGTPGGFHYPGVSPDGVILVDSWFHVVVTRDITGLFVCYVDGVEMFDFMDEQDDAVIDAPSGKLRFFQPDEEAILQYNVYEVTQGAMDYLRIYDEALSPQDAIGLFSPSVVLGDFDGDGYVTVADVNPFVLALTDRDEFENAYPNVDADFVGDMDGNGVFNLGDVSLFKAAVSGASSGTGIAVPEPTSCLLLTLAFVAWLGTGRVVGNGARIDPTPEVRSRGGCFS